MTSPNSSLVPSSQDTQLPTQVRGPLSPEAYQRGPTLMAGATPGIGGAVRVWSPNRRLLRRGTIIAALAGPATLAAMFWLHSFGLLYGLTTCLLATIYGIQALRRPCYITTDDLGIGITTPHGSRSFRWTDIERCDIRTVGTHLPAGMIFYMPDVVEATLTGYSAKEIAEITSLVKEKAGLVRHSRNKYCYLRPQVTYAPIKPPSVGIGITFERNEEGQLFVAAIEDHSPAADSGLMPDDQIISINHLETDHLGEQDAAALCRGPEGALIYLKVERELWHKPLEFGVRTKCGFE